MKFWQVITQSFRAIWRNKGRSFLTTLGIIIGIGSVIALISLGNGVKQNISNQISNLGTTTIIIVPGGQLGNGGGFGGGGNSGDASGGSSFRAAASTLTENDLTALSNQTAHPLIERISGEIQGSAIFTVNGGGQQRYSVLGVSPDFFTIRSLTIGRGALFSAADDANAKDVAVLGSGLATDLYGSINPVGQTLAVNGQNYQIIGVLSAAKASNLNDPNAQLYIPTRAAEATFSASTFSDITVQVKSASDVTTAQTDIKKTLLANHGITNPKLADFSVETSADLLSTVNTITGTLTSLLAGIAAISLVVGGIGIMNIMLVSVTERTREIGLRKAVGATTGAILAQFVCEAILLTLFGGLFGMLIGVLLAKIVAHAIGFSAVFTLSAILLAVGVSSGVGLVFGIYPAARAARLNPIDALRYE